MYVCSLRHVEYYRGVLFLTTNRVEVFDEAFYSRIHVALYFPPLSQLSKEQIWGAFVAECAEGGVTAEEVGELARRSVNGRQIRNAVRVAGLLACERGEEVGFGHFVEGLDGLDGVKGLEGLDGCMIFGV